MEDSMVTARISKEKKAAGNAILERAGLTPSQAVGIMYDKLVKEGSADFLKKRETSRIEWESAARLIDSVASRVPVHTRFDNMTRKEVTLDRLRAKGML